MNQEQNVDEQITVSRSSQEPLREYGTWMEALLDPLLSQQIIEGYPDCIKLLDYSGRILYINNSGPHCIENDDFANRQFTEWTALWTGETRALAEKALDSARMGHRATFDAQSLNVQGMQKWWEVTVMPVPDTQGQVSHLLTISRDITQRKREHLELIEQARMGVLNLAIGIALTQNATLQEMLTHCALALVDHFDAALVQIWTVEADENMLELQASSGPSNDLNENYIRIPFGRYRIGRIAVERASYLTNEIIEDPYIPDQDWVIDEKIVSFAGYPLLLGDRLVGVLAFFARQPLTDATLSTFQTISHTIAIGIERKLIDLQLHASEERFRALANQAPVMIWQSDASSEVTFFNAVWYTFTGLSEKESLGHSWVQAIHIDDRAEVLAKWMQMMATYQPYHTSLRLLRADGVYREVLVHGTASTNQNGEPMGYIGIFLDITEQKDLERQREDFLSMAAHELKTPLTALQGNVQLAQRHVHKVLAQADLLPPSQQTFLTQAIQLLKRSQENVKMQNRLINDLLDMSRAQSEKLELHRRPSDLIALVQETIQDQQSASPQRTIVLDLKDQAAITVLVDPERIKQVVSNYVTNALKYSPMDQPVHIGVSSNNMSARVWVQDCGIGLTQKQQTHIWERFYQTKEMTVSNEGSPGLGLGLYICQMLIQAHEGEVGVESTKGVGSTFWFTLPMLQLHDQAGDQNRL